MNEEAVRLLAAIEGPLSPRSLRVEALTMVVRQLMTMHPERDAIKANIEAALTTEAVQYPELAVGLVQGLRMQLRDILPEWGT